MVRRVNPFSALFKPPPDQWGLRGDPFLWRAMARVLSGSTFPRTEVQLIGLVETAFERLTGSRLPDENSTSEDDSIYVKRYARGGMSSGQISLKFWRGSALPLLRSRYINIRQSLPNELPTPKAPSRAVPKSTIIDPINEAQGERCKSFWEHLIARHPLEVNYSKPTKLAYRWREIPGLRLVVAQYISFAGNQVGVFIRGERSVAAAAVYSRLKPFASALQKSLRRELLPDTKYFLHKGKEFQTEDTAKWDRMADWLHENANDYEDALRRITRGVA
jgi:hypothetical protein